ncbi:MAG: hypothetical protein K6F53_04890 [Lachnospiraceae bacterium]|nr:hypothetical protein [Lachnospiraceae bacterium]
MVEYEYQEKEWQKADGCEVHFRTSEKILSEYGGFFTPDFSVKYGNTPLNCHRVLFILDYNPELLQCLDFFNSVPYHFVVDNSRL